MALRMARGGGARSAAVAHSAEGNARGESVSIHT